MKRKDLVFAKKINDSEETGIINVQTQQIICTCTEEMSAKILDAFKTAEKYEELEEKVSEYYDEENPKHSAGGLDDIGEMVAIHFGFL